MPCARSALDRAALAALLRVPAELTFAVRDQVAQPLLIQAHRSAGDVYRYSIDGLSAELQVRPDPSSRNKRHACSARTGTHGRTVCEYLRAQLRIGDMLTIVALGRLARVSRAWRTLAGDQRLWKQQYIRLFGATAATAGLLPLRREKTHGGGALLTVTGTVGPHCVRSQWISRTQTGACSCAFDGGSCLPPPPARWFHGPSMRPVSPPRSDLRRPQATRSSPRHRGCKIRPHWAGICRRPWAVGRDRPAQRDARLRYGAPKRTLRSSQANDAEDSAGRGLVGRGGVGRRWAGRGLAALGGAGWGGTGNQGGL